VKGTRHFFVKFKNKSFVEVGFTGTRDRLRMESLTTQVNVDRQWRINVVVIQMLKKCSATTRL